MSPTRLEDVVAREAIRHTITTYVMKGDSGDAAGFVATFTEDGVLEMDGLRCAGHAALLDWVRTARPYGDDIARPAARIVRHHLTTCHIELDGDAAAAARTYFQTLTDIGLDHYGYYVDRLRKVGDDWLIAHRRVRIQWRAPDSFTRAESRDRH